MANNKLSAEYREAVKEVQPDEAVTAVIRTKGTPGPDREILEQIQSMVQAERLATRRSDLLRHVTAATGRERRSGKTSSRPPAPLTPASRNPRRRHAACGSPVPLPSAGPGRRLKTWRGMTTW